jgi:MFS family permease
MTNSTLTERRDPPSFFRWAVLVVVSLAMFGNYYIYDSIAPVADLLKTQLNFSDENIGSLYSIYSIAAVIVLIFGGIIIDKYGTKVSILIFSIICSVTALLTAITDNFSIMLIGRFLLGVGAEPLIVAITVALAKWFKGKELGFALGINLSIARLAQIYADWSPTVHSEMYSGWQEPLFLAVIVGLTCLIGGGIYFAMEAYAARKFTLAKAEETEKLVFKDLTKFNKSFWLIVMLCVVFYSAIFPFRSFAIKFYQHAHDIDLDLAGRFNSALPFASMVVAPLFGLLADKIGKRALLMMFGSVLLLPVYLLMGYTDISLYIPIAMMGISFSLIPAVMWPSVAYIVDEKRLGTAYSVMTLIQQLGVAGFNWMIGVANDSQNASAANPDGYNLGMWLFSVLGLLGLLFAYLLRRAETGPNNHGLENPSGHR